MPKQTFEDRKRIANNVVLLRKIMMKTGEICLLIKVPGRL